MVELTHGIVPDFENDGAQETTAPADGTKPLRIVALLVGQVRLIEYLLARRSGRAQQPVRAAKQYIMR